MGKTVCISALVNSWQEYNRGNLFISEAKLKNEDIETIILTPNFEPHFNNPKNTITSHLNQLDHMIIGVTFERLPHNVTLSMMPPEHSENNHDYYYQFFRIVVLDAANITVNLYKESPIMFIDKSANKFVLNVYDKVSYPQDISEIGDLFHGYFEINDVHLNLFNTHNVCINAKRSDIVIHSDYPHIPITNCHIVFDDTCSVRAFAPQFNQLQMVLEQEHTSQSVSIDNLTISPIHQIPTLFYPPAPLNIARELSIRGAHIQTCEANSQGIPVKLHYNSISEHVRINNSFFSNFKPNKNIA